LNMWNDLWIMVSIFLPVSKKNLHQEFLAEVSLIKSKIRKPENLKRGGITG
jgi:hypothetical protein